MYGLFGVGDGATTFRAPKNAGEFWRALDTLKVLDATNITGNTHSNITIDGISDTTLLAVGMKVTGSGIQANTTIASIVNSTTITINNAATATANGVTLTIIGRRLGSMQADLAKVSINTMRTNTQGFINADYWGSPTHLSPGCTQGTTVLSTQTQGGPETRGHNVAYYGAIKY